MLLTYHQWFRPPKRAQRFTAVAPCLDRGRLAEGATAPGGPERPRPRRHPLLWHPAQRHAAGLAAVRRGPPPREVTIPYLDWMCWVVAREGKRVLIVIWDDASWHPAEAVSRWVR